MMLYSQSDTIDYLIRVLDTCTNVQIKSSIIESFSYLNSDNFDKVFSNYKNTIRTQDYGMFFGSLSKIVNKQEFLINYWIKSGEENFQIDEIRFKILKSICVNVYKTELIDKIINYLEQICSSKNQFVLGKIIEMLETNKIISNTINSHTHI